MRSNALKLIISLLLIISVLCFSFSVFAVDEVEATPLPPEQDPITQMDVKLMSYYVWLCMRAWGINITYEESVEFNDAIGVQILNWVLEYLENSPSNYSVSQWIAPWQAGYDYWGNLKFNNSLLEDVQDFSDWLIDKFDLVDNSTVVVDPTYSLNGVSVYKTDTRYPLYWVYYMVDIIPNGQDIIALELTQSFTHWDNIHWFVWHDTEATSITKEYKFVFFTDTQYNVQLGVRASVWDAGSYESSCSSYTNYLFDSNSDIESGWNYKYGNWYIGEIPYCNIARWGDISQFCAAIPADSIVFEGTRAQMHVFLDGAQLTNDSAYLITGQIILPDDDPDYMSGDGMIVIDNNPSYEPITFSGEITNLPAVVSTRDVQNPGIDTVFQPVKAFVTMTKDSMELFIQLIYRLPVEANVCIYALMGSMILLGIIKIMREH